MVPERGVHRSEEQDHPPLGAARDAARSTADQGTQPAYVFGAICPAKGKGVGLFMSHRDNQAMSACPAEIGAVVASDTHAVLVFDGAGWHSSKGLVVHNNIALMPLPPYTISDPFPPSGRPDVARGPIEQHLIGDVVLKCDDMFADRRLGGNRVMGSNRIDDAGVLIADPCIVIRRAQ